MSGLCIELSRIVFYISDFSTTIINIWNAQKTKVECSYVRYGFTCTTEKDGTLRPQCLRPTVVAVFRKAPLCWTRFITTEQKQKGVEFNAVSNTTIVYPYSLKVSSQLDM